MLARGEVPHMETGIAGMNACLHGVFLIGERGLANGKW